MDSALPQVVDFHWVSLTHSIALTATEEDSKKYQKVSMLTGFEPQTSVIWDVGVTINSTTTGVQYRRKATIDPACRNECAP